MKRWITALVAVGMGMAACDPVDRAGGGPGSDPGVAPALGPVDGRDLPATDLDRVRAGDPAPDFTLASLAGPPVTLSSFRGAKNVVLVFYRGHW